MAIKLGPMGPTAFYLGTTPVSAIFIGATGAWSAGPPPTLYFNGAVDGNWTTLGNWWLDPEHASPAPSLPTSANSVVIQASVMSNSGPPPSVAAFTFSPPPEFGGEFKISINVATTAVFELGSLSNGTIYGNASFVNASCDGMVVGNATFANNSYVGGDNGYIDGDATFNDSAYTGQFAIITGNATFNGTSTHGGTIYNNAVFNDAACNNGQVYGTITGSSTCVFPPRTLFFFGYASDGDWANLANWRDGEFSSTSPDSLPTSVDTVYILSNVDTVDGVQLASAGTINTLYVANGATISVSLSVTSMVVFDTGALYLATMDLGVGATATFYGYSSIDGGVLNGTAVFLNTAANYGTINGDATFENSSNNYGTVTGTVTCNTTGIC